MLTIFNGRGLVDKKVHAQIDVAMREHLHEFHNGSNLSALGVFLCIALHADEGGWAFPSRHLIKKETGLGELALKGAFRHLRKMRIDGHRVFAHYRTHDAALHRWGKSAYLIFPDSAVAAGPPPPHLMPLVEYHGGSPNDGSPTGGALTALLSRSHLEGEPVVVEAATISLKNKEGKGSDEDTEPTAKSPAAELAGMGITVPSVVKELGALDVDYIKRHAAHRQQHGERAAWYVTLMRAGEEPHLPGEVAPEPPVPEGMIRFSGEYGVHYLTPAEANERLGYRAYDEAGKVIPAQEAGDAQVFMAV